MKKLILGSVVLSCFSLSVILFQVSCQKTANSQTNGYILPPATATTLGGVIIGNGLTVTSTGIFSVTSNSGLNQLNKLIYKRVSGTSSEIWMANYDGTNNVKINITLPSGIVFNDDMQPTLSPNGQKLFFTAGTSTRGDLYSCNADGSNIIKIVDKGGTSNDTIFGGTY